jgi:putative methionine-R-sulfoxide reductase with GAF domain
MSKPRNDHEAYVRKVQEGASSFAQDLIGEVERLHVLVAALESEKAGLAERSRDVHEMLQANEALRALATSLEGEMNRLHEQSLTLRQENERYKKEQARLSAQLESIRAESQGYSSRYTEIEQQNSNLANLYVASYRLHGTLDRKEVVDTIQEIIANLVGSEEAGLFELNEDGARLDLVASFGLPPGSCPSVPLGSGLIGKAAQTGEILVVEPGQAPADGIESRLTACVPLTLDGRVTGVIAIFGLLPQKAGIEAVDRELFDLLATHAATALYCTSLHARLAVPAVCA